MCTALVRYWHHAYAVSDSAAKKFVSYQTPVHLQADRIFNYYAAERPLKAFALRIRCSRCPNLLRIHTFSSEFRHCPIIPTSGGHQWGGDRRCTLLLWRGFVTDSCAQCARQ